MLGKCGFSFYKCQYICIYTYKRIFWISRYSVFFIVFIVKKKFENLLFKYFSHTFACWMMTNLVLK